MATYTGPFISPTTIIDGFNITDCSTFSDMNLGNLGELVSSASSGIIKGPGYEYACPREKLYSWTCGPSNGYRVLDSILYSRNDSASGTLVGWTNPSVPPPLPAPYIVNYGWIPNVRGGATSCGYWRAPYSSGLISYPTYLYYSAGIWRWGGYSVSILMTFWDLQVYDTNNICPAGTVFNPDTGTCDVLPGWEWDGEAGRYRYYQCLDIDGKEFICDIKTYRYRIYINIPEQEDIDIKISYPKGTLKNGINFIGPTIATIKAGHVDTYIDIKLLNKEEGFFYIALESNAPEQCKEYIVRLACERGDGGYAGDCCDYVAKDFIFWSNGFSTKKLIPPNKR